MEWDRNKNSIEIKYFGISFNLILIYKNILNERIH